MYREKNKSKQSIIFPILIIVVFLMLIFHTVLMYQEYVSPNLDRPREIYKIGSNKRVTGEITKDTKIEQTFTMEHVDFSGIRLTFATYDRKNTSHLNIQLKNKTTGMMLGNWDISSEDLKDNTPVELVLKNTVEVKEKEEYIITIASEDAAAGNAVTVYQSDKSVKGQKLIVGREKKEGSLHVTFTYGDQSYLRVYFVGITVILFAMLVLTWFLGYGMKWEAHRLFLLMGICLGVLYIFILPPYSTPDEQAHIYTAYAFSNSLMGKEAVNEDGNTIAREEDLLMGVLEKRPDTETYGMVADHLFDTAGGKELSAFPGGPLSGVPGFVYTPQIIGISLARLLNIGNVGLLMIGRLFALAFYLLCGYFAVKKMPFAKVLMVTVLLLPISLELGGSFSYDSFIIGVCAWFTGHCLYLAYEKNKVLRSDWILLIILAVLMSPCKIVYVLLCLLVLLIPVKKSATRIGCILGRLSVCAGGLLSLAVVRLVTMTEYLSRQENTLSYIETSGYTLSELLSQPLTIIQMYYDSFRKYGDFYFETMMGGQLGWLDIQISDVLIFALAIILVLAVLAKEKEPFYLEKKDKWIMALISAGVIGALMMVFLLTWTPYGSKVIEGTQGRYFLPVLPLVVLLLRNRNLTLKKSINMNLIMSVGLIQFMVVWEIFQKVITR